MNQQIENPKVAYLQYGCGFTCPESWLNFDASPRLWLQRLPLVGLLFRRGPYVFPPNARFGSITSGIDVPDNSMNGVYASHILEHLALEDFRTALRNTYKMLKPGGYFRLVVPDLEQLVGYYLARINRADKESAHFLMRSTQLGRERRRRGLMAMAQGMFGNDLHLWMWDQNTLTAELEAAGFVGIRRCEFDDCADKHFAAVESKDRFEGCCAMEARKP